MKNFYMFKSKKKYNRIVFSYTFVTENNPYNSTYFWYLTYILGYSTKRYPTSDKLEFEMSNLYNASYSINYNIRNSIGIMSFSISFINPKLINDPNYTIKHVYDTFKSLVFEPNFVNGAFRKSEYSRMKREISFNLLESKTNISKYSYRRSIELFYKGYNQGLIEPGSMSVARNMTIKSLSQFYSENICFKKAIFDCLGDVKKQEFDDIKRFNIKYRKQRYDFIFKPNVTRKIEYSNFKETSVEMLYYMPDNYDDKNFYIPFVFNSIFGGESSSYLFTKIREQEGLCYSISSYYDKKRYTLRVSALIDKENVERFITHVSTIINDITINGVDVSYLEDIKKTYIYDLLRQEDRMSYCRTEKLSKILYDYKNYRKEAKEEFINNISNEDIKDFAKKLQNPFVYCLLPKEVKNEEI